MASPADASSFAHAAQVGLPGVVVVSQIGVAVSQAAAPPHIHIPVVSAFAQTFDDVEWQINDVVSHWHCDPSALHSGFNDVQPE